MINISFGVNKGDFVVISGKSGCGKTTLLKHLKPSLKPEGEMRGTIILDEEIENDDTKIGFVFQDYYLDEKLTALENVLLPTIINKDISSKEAKTKAIDLLNKFGLDKRTNHLPSTLSGG